MRSRGWIVLVIALVAGACSSKTPTPSASGTSSTTASPSPSPSASKKAAHVPSARRALYVYKGMIWLYDARTNGTRQLTQGGTARLPKWISADRISYLQGSNDGTESTLRILDLKTSKATDSFSVSTGINTYGWSPDRQTVAYITTDGSGYPHVRFRSVDDGATQSIATLARALGRGAEPNDDARVEFSKDGRYVLVVYTPADGVEGQKVPNDQSQLQVRALDGTLAFAGDMSREPTMGIWSPDGKALEFRDSGGIRTWTPAMGESHVVRNGLRWFEPWPSRDGKLVAFDTGSNSPSVVVRILTLRSAKYDTVSAAGRAFPVFAGPRTVWAQQVRACKDCLFPAEPIDHVFAIDTVNGKERALPIQSLQDVDVFYV